MVDTIRESGEHVSTLASAIRAGIDASLRELHTMIPGVFDDYDADTQTATVTPQLNRVIRTGDGELVDAELPQIRDVPVHFVRAGGFAITVPIQPGDPCMILFAERNIKGYLEHGKRERPPSSRLHNYSDAVAIPGLPPSAGAISPAPSADSIELRSDDGTTVIEIGPAGIKINTVGAAGVAIAPTIGPFSVNTIGRITLTRGVNELLEVLSTALDEIASSTAGGFPLSNQSNIQQQRALIDLIRA